MFFRRMFDILSLNLRPSEVQLMINSTICIYILDILAAKSNLIKFGDSAIGESKTLSFTMTNHSTTDCIKFVWPEHTALKFAPNTGHIHSGLHKDMTVTFKADEVHNLNEENVLCSVTKITFEKESNEVRSTSILIGWY